MNMKEYIEESILDPIKSELSPDLWKGEKLKPSARSIIVKRLETWLKTKTSKPIQRLLLLGSITGYQYTNSSDIDVNFVVNISDERLIEIAKEMSVELNGKNLSGTEHPVNYYISNEFKKEWKGKSLYDIYKDKWIQKPTTDGPTTVITNYRAVSEIARFFIAGLDLVISEYEADVASFESYQEALKGLKTKEDIEDANKLINFKLQEVISDIDGIFIAKHMLKALRKEAFKEDNEALKISTKIDIRDKSDNSINNLIYKYVEKLGYFTKIQDILDKKDYWNNKIQAR
jgi:hypothetical protein